jgi:hypothetical protein
MVADILSLIARVAATTRARMSDRRRTNAAADRGDECAFVQASNTLCRFGAVNRRLQLPFIRADSRFAVAQAGQAAKLKVWRCRSGYALAPLPEKRRFKSTTASFTSAWSKESDASQIDQTVERSRRGTRHGPG